MPFIPHTEADIGIMLGRLGLKRVDELFDDIPEGLRFPKLDLPAPLSELEALDDAERLAAGNAHAGSYAWFLGAGIYNHFVASAVKALASRGEWATAYTPYQAEASQGTLQAMFEYQSMAAELLGMDVVNASHYDGATAMAEAVLMALRRDAEGEAGAAGSHGGGPVVMLPAMLHPEYRQVMETYLSPREVRLIQYSKPPREAARELPKRIACMVCASPDFSGEIHDLGGVAERVRAAGGLLIVQADPVMLGLFKSPGDYGADIAVAEGQGLGMPMNFSGPTLGMMGVRTELLRRMPGRLAGQAFDASGRRGFTLTLSAREQHIRREKAVSNICTNQGLCALQAAMHMAALGPEGMRRQANLCWDKAHYAAAVLSRLPGCSVLNRLFFKEFILRLPVPAAQAAESLAEKGIVAGLPLGRYWPERVNDLLVCVTEMNPRREIDALAEALREVI
jgi:glycine dehydrogenase subunit 1